MNLSRCFPTCALLGAFLFGCSVVPETAKVINGRTVPPVVLELSRFTLYNFEYSGNTLDNFLVVRLDDPATDTAPDLALTFEAKTRVLCAVTPSDESSSPALGRLLKSYRLSRIEEEMQWEDKSSVTFLLQGERGPWPENMLLVFGEKTKKLDEIGYLDRDLAVCIYNPALDTLRVVFDNP